MHHVLMHLVLAGVHGGYDLHLDGGTITFPKDGGELFVKGLVIGTIIYWIGAALGLDKKKDKKGK